MQDKAFSSVFWVPGSHTFWSLYFGQVLEQHNIGVMVLLELNTSLGSIKLQATGDKDFDPLAAPEWVITLAPWHAHNEHVMKFSN